MKVAELQISYSQPMSPGFVETIGFSSLDEANAEYDHLEELLKRREARANDLPKTISITNGIKKFTCPLDMISSVGLLDFVHANAQDSQVRETFPNLFK